MGFGLFNSVFSMYLLNSIADISSCDKIHTNMQMLSLVSISLLVKVSPVVGLEKQNRSIKNKKIMLV